MGSLETVRFRSLNHARERSTDAYQFHTPQESSAVLALGFLTIKGFRQAKDRGFSRVESRLRFGIIFIHPFHLLLAALAHWLNREQAAIIDYLKEENRVLRDRLGSKRIRFTDAERKRLTVKAKLLGRSLLRILVRS